MAYKFVIRGGGEGKGEGKGEGRGEGRDEGRGEGRRFIQREIRTAACILSANLYLSIPSSEKITMREREKERRDRGEGGKREGRERGKRKRGEGGKKGKREEHTHQ